MTVTSFHSFEIDVFSIIIIISLFHKNKPIGALLLQQFLIGGWKEVRWAGGGGWVSLVKKTD
jgi:hypothetical protein